MITEVELEKIKEDAIATYPEEAVWLVTEEKGCYQVKNIHEDPTNFFRISADDSLAATLSGLLAIVHSHCDAPEVPSKEDMELFDKVNVPCGIVSTDGEWTSDILWLTNETPELVGRPFIHGISDCYTLSRDYYKTKGIHLPLVPRNWNNWENNSDDYMENLFKSMGFHEVPKSEAREGDGWLAIIRGSATHHCGILLDNDLILHHPGASEPIDRSKLSVIEPIYRYMPFITKFIRFKE